MVRTLTRIVLASSIPLALIAMSPASAGSSGEHPRVPIGGQQYFFGEVNGNHTNAEVYVVCPGPVWEGRTGPPLAGQPLGVLLVGQGEQRGFTGDGARAIAVGFMDDPSARVRLDQYGITKPIPTSLALPCDGTGVVRFQSVPKSAGSVPDDVTVAYVNIAA